MSDIQGSKAMETSAVNFKGIPEKCIRAAMLTLSDVKSGLGKTWPATAAVTLLYIAYWAIMLLTGSHASPEDRQPVLYLAAMFFAFTVPSAVYGHINDPSDGIGFAMLPLPVWLKFSVMMLVATVVLPLCFYLCIYATDCILALAGGGSGFSGMIWDSGGTDIAAFWSDFGRICLYQSVFVLGNICLRRHKVAITVLVMLAAHGILISLFHIDGAQRGILFFLYSYCVPVLVWIASFLMFKRMQFR